MTVKHMQGPLVVFGQASGDYNPSLGISPMWGGGSMLDPRGSYQPGQDVTGDIPCWSDNTFTVISQVPSALAAANIAPATAAVAGTPLPLVTTSGAGITVGAKVTNLTTGAQATVLAIDSAMAVIAYGTDATVQCYDPRTAIALNVRATCAGNDTGGTLTVRGFSIYGEPMSEAIALGTAAVYAGKKAFKYILSATPSGTLSGNTISVGTGDVIGLPLRVDNFENIQIWYGAPPPALVSAATGFLAADATSPATGTTGDVRGTYALQSASNGTNKLVVSIGIMPWNLAPNAVGVYAGLFGVPNFTN